MTTLTITSLNQGFGYTEGCSVQSFAVVEQFVGFCSAVLLAIRRVKVEVATLRSAYA